MLEALFVPCVIHNHLIFLVAVCYPHFIDEETNTRCLSNLSRIIKPESDRYLDPRKLESGTYLVVVFFFFFFFFNHSAHLPPWGNQDGLWRLNTHMAMANWGDSSWSLTCCIFKGLLTWVIERGSSCYTQDTAQSHYSDEPLHCPPFLGCGSTKSSLLWIGQESKEL